MNHVEKVRYILRDALQLGARADSLTEESRLMGAIPEFDSMAVVSVIGMIEEEFGITIEDDEMSGDIFETLGSLSAFIRTKVEH